MTANQLMSPEEGRYPQCVLVDLNILHNEDRCVDELMMSLWGFLIREDFYLILLWETGQVPFID